MRKIFLLGLGLMLSVMATAQVTVKGKVMDAISGELLEGATISTRNQSALSGRDGSYTLVADTSTGDRFALESFTQYLDVMQKGEPGVAALLKIDVFENPDAVEVELSGAHVAILSVADHRT